MIFTYDRELIQFDICNKIIVYKDRKWFRGFQFMPKDPNIIKTILLSRNSIRKEMIKWIEDANSGKNLEEYNNAKDDEELSMIVRKDSELKGCVFRKKMYVTFDDDNKEVEIKK